MTSQSFARSSEKGFSLIEAVMAIGVLTVGMLGVAAVLTTGMERLTSSPGDVIATQKASEAIESVFAARDSHKLTWAQIKNIHGATGNDGGIFLDGAQRLMLPGTDGVVNTTDDLTAGYETDDDGQNLSGFTREIQIRDIPNEANSLRSITVTISYKSGRTTRNYTLTTYISNYS